MYKYILFDLDGTLTNPKEGITKCVQYALKYFNIDEPNLDNLTKFIGPPLQESFERFYNFSKENAKLAVEKYRERFSTIGLFENGVYDGIKELLKALKREGKILAVATSKPEVFSLRILEKYELKEYFDVICGSELDGRRTIKAEVIEEVFNRLHLKDDEKSSVVMIGDRKHDIIGAKALSIDSIGVKFGYAEENELENAGANFIAETVEDLKRLLLSSGK